MALITDLNQIDSKEEKVSSSKNQITRTVIMTRTEITEYPDGRKFLKSNSWVQGQPMAIKTKKNVKKEVKESAAQINEMEEY